MPGIEIQDLLVKILRPPEISLALGEQGLLIPHLRFAQDWLFAFLNRRWRPFLRDQRLLHLRPSRSRACRNRLRSRFPRCLQSQWLKRCGISHNGWLGGPFLRGTVAA